MKDQSMNHKYKISVSVVFALDAELGTDKLLALCPIVGWNYIIMIILLTKKFIY